MLLVVVDFAPAAPPPLVFVAVRLPLDSVIPDEIVAGSNVVAIARYRVPRNPKLILASVASALPGAVIVNRSPGANVTATVKVATPVAEVVNATVPMLVPFCLIVKVAVPVLAVAALNSDPVRLIGSVKARVTAYCATNSLAEGRPPTKKFRS